MLMMERTRSFTTTTRSRALLWHVSQERRLARLMGVQLTALLAQDVPKSKCIMRDAIQKLHLVATPINATEIVGHRYATAAIMNGRSLAHRVQSNANTRSNMIP